MQYDVWIRRELEKTSQMPYLVTFMFNHLSGGEDARCSQMQNEITFWYSTLLTRLIRKPNSSTKVGLVPLLIAAPDYPSTAGGSKLTVEDATINDGLHYHGILLAPPPELTRLGWGVDHEVENNKERYLGRHGKLRRIHVLRLKDTDLDFVGYALKTLATTPRLNKDILILPRSKSELPVSKIPEGDRPLTYLIYKQISYLGQGNTMKLYN